MNDDAPRHIRVVAVALVLLAGWIVWALVGRVSIVAVSKRARFESRRAVRQIAIPVSGRITSVNIVGATMNNNATEDCLMAEIMRWEFPAASEPTVVGSYPFVFDGNTLMRHTGTTPASH